MHVMVTPPVLRKERCLHAMVTPPTWWQGVGFTYDAMVVPPMLGHFTIKKGKS